MDPIRFARDIKVTMQAIGWRSEGRYLPLQDDIASVAYLCFRPNRTGRSRRFRIVTAWKSFEQCSPS